MSDAPERSWLVAIVGQRRSTSEGQEKPTGNG